MSVQTSRPITEGEFNHLLGDVLKEVSTFYRTEIQPQQAELNAKRAELDEKAVRIQQEIVEAREMKEQGAEMKARGLQGLKEVAQEKQVIAQERINLLVEAFYSIFKKTALPETEKPKICNLVIPKAKLSVEESADGKGFLQMNSAKPVIKYSEANPGIKALDLRHFMDKISTKTFEKLANYLASPTCPVTAVAFKDFIPSEAKTRLAEVVAQRIGAKNGALLVKYYK